VRGYTTDGVWRRATESSSDQFAERKPDRHKQQCAWGTLYYQRVIIVSMPRRNPSLDTLLDLHGQVLVIDEAGYWVRFVVNQVPATADKPHGLDYTLTMHGPDGARLVGFDNAHQVAGQRSTPAAKDHKHRLRAVKPYEYMNAGALVAAFWSEVESVMRERGVWT
jgi:hypothetical protein